MVGPTCNGSIRNPLASDSTLFYIVSSFFLQKKHSAICWCFFKSNFSETFSLQTPAHSAGGLQSSRFTNSSAVRSLHCYFTHQTSHHHIGLHHNMMTFTMTLQCTFNQRLLFQFVGYLSVEGGGAVLTGALKLETWTDTAFAVLSAVNNCRNWQCSHVFFSKSSPKYSSTVQRRIFHSGLFDRVHIQTVNNIMYCTDCFEKENACC